MTVEPVHLTTSDGLRLEAELSAPDGAWGAALLCHPHPQQGGSMRSIVTGTQFRELPARGLAVLRFNFRGVEGSEGDHDHGRGERLDVVAALGALAEITEGLPLVISGWSFGADTSLAVDDARHHGWVPIAPPLRVIDPTTMVAATDPRPKHLVVPENDQFRPPESAREIVAGWVNTEVEAVPGADHFLVGRLDAAVDAVVHTVRGLSTMEPFAR